VVVVVVVAVPAMPMLTPAQLDFCLETTRRRRLALAGRILLPRIRPRIRKVLKFMRAAIGSTASASAATAATDEQKKKVPRELVKK
jgi:hypothetical protein